MRENLVFGISWKGVRIRLRQVAAMLRPSCFRNVVSSLRLFSFISSPNQDPPAYPPPPLFSSRCDDRRGPFLCGVDFFLLSVFLFLSMIHVFSLTFFFCGREGIKRPALPGKIKDQIPSSFFFSCWEPLGPFCPLLSLTLFPFFFRSRPPVHQPLASWGAPFPDTVSSYDSPSPRPGDRGSSPDTPPSRGPGPSLPDFSRGLTPVFLPACFWSFPSPAPN